MKPQQFSAFAAVARHAARNHWFDCFWQEVAPPGLTQRVRVLNVRESVLVLAAADSAAATQARFQAPQWLAALNTAAKKQHIDGVTRIEVRVVPPPTPQTKPRCAPRTLSEATRTHLRTVADHIDDPQLADVLRRLAQQKTPAGTINS